MKKMIAGIIIGVVVALGSVAAGNAIAAKYVNYHMAVAFEEQVREGLEGRDVETKIVKRGFRDYDVYVAANTDNRLPYNQFMFERKTIVQSFNER